MQAIAVERSVWINAPRERVWQAVTDPDQLILWYSSSRWEIPTLALGATVRFFNKETPEETDILTATIDVLEPPRLFTLRWSPDKTYPELVQVTSFILEEENGGTRATIHESGYEGLPPDARREWMETADQGYLMSMDHLKALVEA